MIENICNFIEIYKMYDTSYCDNIIQWFDSNKDKQNDGIQGNERGISVDKSIKDTTDISLSIYDVQLDDNLSKIFYPIFSSLQYAINSYILKYEILNPVPYKINESFNIQKYVKGQHFIKPHFESSNIYNRDRFLTWMVYLNDVENGGSTKFPYYSLSIKPSKGNILIWPAEFTHTHFGDIVEDEKYIITGWFKMNNPHFMEEVKNNIKVKYFNF